MTNFDHIAEGSNKFVLTEAVLKDCIQKIENETRRISIREIEFVIRCKNCKYYTTNTELLGNVCNRLFTVFPMKSDDFCSYGERKDEE